MKRAEADIRAMRLWSTKDGSMRGRAWIRRGTEHPCEVGYESKSGPRGGWVDTILGRGRTWEEAFAHAEERKGEPL